MEMKITLDGGRKVTAHLEDGTTIPTDQPVDEGGSGTAPTPVDLFIASLATCAGVYVQDFCNHREIPTERITLHQSADFTVDADGKYRLATVSLRIDLPEDFPEKYRPAVVRVAELCMVKKTVLNPPEFRVILSPVGNQS